MKLLLFGIAIIMCLYASVYAIIHKITWDEGWPVALLIYMIFYIVRELEEGDAL